MVVCGQKGIFCVNLKDASLVWGGIDCVRRALMYVASDLTVPHLHRVCRVYKGTTRYSLELWSCTYPRMSLTGAFVDVGAWAKLEAGFVILFT